MHTKTKPINTCILEISSQNKAILDFFFASGGESLFKESRREDAAAFMLDYDFPGAKQSWDTLFQSTKKPAIIFSINKVELPSTIWVAKPLTAKTLTNAGVELRELIDHLETESIEAIEEEHAALEVETLSEKVEATHVIENVERIPESFADVEQDEDSKGKKSSYDDIVLGKVNSENNLFTETSTDDDELDQLLKSIESDDVFDDVTPDNEVNTLNSIEEVPFALEETETVEEIVKEGVTTAEPLADETPVEAEVDLFGIPIVTKTVVPKKEITEITTELNNDDLLNQINEDKEAIAENSVEESSPETNWNETDDELDQLLKSIKNEFDTTPTIKTEKTVAPTTNKAPITAAAARWEMLCGNYKDVKETEINSLFFNTKDYFFNFALTAINQAKTDQTVLHIQYYDISITIDPILGLIYSTPSIKSESFSLFCFKPLKHNEVKKQTLGSDEIKVARAKMGADLENVSTFEAFIWTASMLTSKGRLPQTTDINKIVSIKHWPDLTRMEQIPHAIRIAAVFYKHPGTLIEIAKWLKIPQSNVFAFYNAVLALEMVEHKEAPKEEQHYFHMDKTETEGQIEKPKDRGLFSRLLNKLAS